MVMDVMVVVKAVVREVETEVVIVMEVVRDEVVVVATVVMVKIVKNVINVDLHVTSKETAQS